MHLTTASLGLFCLGLFSSKAWESDILDIESASTSVINHFGILPKAGIELKSDASCVSITSKAFGDL